MVIYHIGKIVRGISVIFDQYHVVQLCIVHTDVPVDVIMEGSGSFPGVILADDKGHSCL